jgi:hypothetical protein
MNPSIENVESAWGCYLCPACILIPGVEAIFVGSTLVFLF